MTIKKYLDFYLSWQIIKGFEDLGFLRHSTAVSCRVRVFILRELFTNWKQLLACFVSKSGIKRDDLSTILDKILDAFKSRHPILLSTTCFAKCRRNKRNQFNTCKSSDAKKKKSSSSTATSTSAAALWHIHLIFFSIFYIYLRICGIIY